MYSLAQHSTQHVNKMPHKSTCPLTMAATTGTGKCYNSCPVPTGIIIIEPACHRFASYHIWYMVLCTWRSSNNVVVHHSISYNMARARTYRLLPMQTRARAILTRTFQALGCEPCSCVPCFACPACHAPTAPRPHAPCLCACPRWLSRPLICSTCLIALLSQQFT